MREREGSNESKGEEMKKVQEWVGRHRIVISMTGAVLLFFLANPSPLSLRLGFPIILFGEAIRVWSSGHIRKDRALTVDGPYSLSRNPLYLGNFFLGLGISVTGRSFPMVFLFLVGFYLIYKPTIAAEEKKLFHKFGADYSAYCQKVPRFFPSFRRWDLERGEFEWQRVLGHREYRTWLGILGILLLLALRTKLI